MTYLPRAKFVCSRRSTFRLTAFISMFCALSVISLQAQEVEHSEIVRTTTQHAASTNIENGESWGLELTQEELKQHEQLMTNLRRYISDESISPFEVLGIHASDSVSRKSYAKRWARIMYEDTKRVLLFQREFDKAMAELIANEPLIDVSKLPAKSSLPTLLATDRVLLFVKDDCYLCSLATETILSRLEFFEALDVYFTGSDEQDQSVIHAWAMHHNVDPYLVESRKITLNFDNGTLAEIYPRAERVPVLLRLREGIPSPISLTDIEDLSD